MQLCQLQQNSWEKSHGIVSSKNWARLVMILRYFFLLGKMNQNDVPLLVTTQNLAFFNFFVDILPAFSQNYFALKWHVLQSYLPFFLCIYFIIIYNFNHCLSSCVSFSQNSRFYLDGFAINDHKKYFSYQYWFYLGLNTGRCCIIRWQN